MRNLAFFVILSVGVGSGFGDASAETISTDGTSMIVAIEIEVDTTANAMIAHLASPGNETLTLPLLDRGGGVYGIQTEIRQIDYRVTFERLGPTPQTSDPVSLSSMGATFGDGGTRPITTASVDEGLSNETRRWGWLALALAAASLSVLALWVVVGSRDEDEESAGSVPGGEEGGGHDDGSADDHDTAGETR